jgi:hypothetical protein
MSAADRVIAWSTALAVTGVAAVVTQERSTRLTLCERTAKRARGRSEPADRRRLDLREFDVRDSGRRSMPLPALARCLLGRGAGSPMCSPSILGRIGFSSRVSWRMSCSPRGVAARIRVTSSAVSGRLASRLMRSSPRNNLNFADRRAFLAGVPRRSGDALPGVAEVGDDLELAAEGADVVSQGGELGD